MVQVKGRVAWVSGGAQGIGLAATKQLIARGAKVVMVDICNYTLGQKSVVEANKAAGTLGGSAVFFRADVTDTDQLRASFLAAKKEFGSPASIIFNNAGIVVNDDSPKWKMMIQLNTVAVIEGTYIALELIAADADTKAQGAVIVNTASLAGIHPITSTPAYTASKHAVVGFTRACGNLMNTHNTRVAALCPALVETPDVGSFFKTSLAKEGGALAKLAENPLDADVVAGIFVKLVEDDSYNLTCAVVTTRASWDQKISLGVNKDAIITPAARL